MNILIVYFLTKNYKEASFIMKKIYLLLILIIVLFTGYFIIGKAPTNKNTLSLDKEINTNATNISSALVMGTGVVKSPSGIEAEDLQIVSLGIVSEVDKSGNFSTTLYQETVTPVIAMLPDKEFGLMGLNEPGKNEVEIDLQTTAKTLVFMSPYLISTDPELAKEIVGIIKKDEKVKEFANVIGEVLQRDIEPLDDPEYLDAFGRAIESVLYTLNDL